MPWTVSCLRLEMLCEDVTPGCGSHADNLVQRLAYRSGVSTAITSPISDGLLGGLGTYFSLGAKHKLEREAVLSDVTAVHVAVLHQIAGGPSVSTQIAALRRLLLGPYTGERGASFEAVVKVLIHDTDCAEPESNADLCRESYHWSSM